MQVLQQLVRLARGLHAACMQGDWCMRSASKGTAIVYVRVLIVVGLSDVIPASPPLTVIEYVAQYWLSLYPNYIR
jgi:hypothetical protein